MPERIDRKFIYPSVSFIGELDILYVPGTFTERPTMATKRVLFVCVENSNRSQMAEAFARMHGGEGVDAASAGSRPSGRINPRAVTAMQEVGYDLTSHDSKGLEDFNGTDVDVAVTMGCGDNCPLVRASRREDWQIPDPREMSPEEFREVRDLIERKVLTLLSDLGVSS